MAVDRADRSDPIARHIRGPASAEVPREAVLDARDVALGLEQSGDGRPAQRARVVGVELGGDVVDAQSEVPETVERSLEPDPATRALLDQRGLECVVGGIDAEAQDVKLALPELGQVAREAVDLDAGEKREVGGESGRYRPPGRGRPTGRRGR